VPIDATILEIGGGASSLWWLERGNRVTTFESDQKWAIQIKAKTSSYADRHNLFIFDKPEEITQHLEGQVFDVTINDGSVDRNICSQILIKHQKTEGLMVWDNSDRSEYLSGLDELKLSGWKPLDFFGLGPINAFASQTTVFTQSAIFPNGRLSEFKTIAY